MANYIPAGTDLTDPRLSPQHGEVTGLPPAYIASAGFDPVRDDGEAYAEKLRAGGIPVALTRQADLPTDTSTLSAWAVGSPKPRAKPPARCDSASPWVQDRRPKGEPVNLSGLAISHRAQTFPSRTVIAVIRGIISRCPSLAGQAGRVEPKLAVDQPS